MPPQVQPTCFAMLRAVPRGRSFFGWGTTTMIVPFLNLWCDPLTLTSSKPSASRRLTMSRLLRSMRNYIHTVDIGHNGQAARPRLRREARDPARRRTRAKGEAATARRLTCRRADRAARHAAGAYWCPPRPRALRRGPINVSAHPIHFADRVRVRRPRLRANAGFSIASAHARPSARPADGLARVSRCPSCRWAQPGFAMRSGRAS